MTYRICKSIEIACAHKLRNYEGKCANLHGHNYKIEVTLESKDLNKLNMLMDFTELKGIMKRHIENTYDHKNINEVAPFRTENPTAEYMAGFFFFLLKEPIKSITGGFIKLKKVRVYETSTSYAEYLE